jgi:transketolase
VYLRFGKHPLAHLHPPQTQFTMGKALTVCEGTDVAFIATGETVHPALMAARELQTQGVSVRVISMHTVKPLDVDSVIQAARECRAVITVEEHSVFGGLGEACAAVLLQAGIQIPFRIIGFPDEYMVTGSQLEIFEHYGITAQGLARTVRALLTR